MFYVDLRTVWTVDRIPPVMLVHEARWLRNACMTSRSVDRGCCRRSLSLSDGATACYADTVVSAVTEKDARLVWMRGGTYME